jgi:hypothetical protein
VLVKTGHTVTIAIPKQARSVAGLGYGPLPQGKIRLGDTHPVLTFKPCASGKPSYGSARKTVGPVTFWSGHVIVRRAPVCVPLDVYVDHDPVPERLVMSLAAGRCVGF